ncbi:MAG: hypothetical protein GY941_22110 [Planctomycetes bacterium]|nr:hypothetical protein [Planctomycetota bacterium]
MAKKILEYYWDFGDGNTSTSASPLNKYGVGRYDVTLVVEYTDGTTDRVDKTFYITVIENDQALSGWDYLNNYNSLHYGWKDEHGFGWSRNKRDSWVLPTTSSSVYNFNEAGIDYTIVWDTKDAKPYIINPKEAYEANAVYQDKVAIDGTGGIDFPTSVTFPEITGDMTHYDLQHLETNVLFRPEIVTDEYGDDFSVNFSLLVDGEKTPVETQFKQDIASEIVFYYQNVRPKESRTRQLKIDTNTSKYQLMNIESYFRVADRFKLKSRIEVQGSSADFVMGSLAGWWTRGKGYELDRVSSVTTTQFGTSPRTGVDGNADTAIAKNGNIEYPTDCSGKVVSMWSSHELAGWTSVGVSNGWELLYRTDLTTLIVDATFGVFDIRVFNDQISEQDFLSAAPEYLANLERYLPRY